MKELRCLGWIRVFLFTPGPTYSQGYIASTLETDLRSTATISHVGHVTRDPPWRSLAAAGGGACTRPVLGYTPGSTFNMVPWKPPVYNTGGVVMGEDNIVPMLGGSSVHSCHQCTCGPPGHRKPPTLGTATTMENKGMSQNTSLTVHRGLSCLYHIQH